MKKIASLLLLAIMAMTWTSCEEDKEEPSGEKTKTELLTAHTWELTAATISPAYNGETNVLELRSCYQDNFESYTSNGSFVKNEGNDVCSPFSDENSGTWSFNSSETVLQFEYDDINLEESYNLLELSDNTLKYSGIIEEDDVEYTLTFTFTAQ